MSPPPPPPPLFLSLTHAVVFLSFFICKVNLVARLLLRLHYSGLLFITTASLFFLRALLSAPDSSRRSHAPPTSRQTGNEKPAHTPVGDSRGGQLGFYWEGRNFEYNLLSPLSFFSRISPSGSKNRRRTRALPWIAGW